MAQLNYTELSTQLNNIVTTTKAQLTMGGKTVGIVTGVTITQDPDVRRAYSIGEIKPYLATGIVPVRVTIGKLIAIKENTINTGLSSFFGDGVLSAGTFANPIDFSLTFDNNKTITVKGAVLSSYGVFVNAGDTFIVENLTFEAATVEQ